MTLKGNEIVYESSPICIVLTLVNYCFVYRVNDMY